MTDKVTNKPVSTDHNFWRERRAEAASNRGPSAYQPNALPLGQTGSQNHSTLRFVHIWVVNLKPQFFSNTATFAYISHNRDRQTSVQVTDIRTSWCKYVSSVIFRVAVVVLNVRRWWADVIIRDKLCYKFLGGGGGGLTCYYHSESFPSKRSGTTKPTELSGLFHIHPFPSRVWIGPCRNGAESQHDCTKMEKGELR